MKLTLPLSLCLLGCLSLGCVVGPEEVAAEKKAQAESAEKAMVAETAKEAAQEESGIKTVSDTTTTSSESVPFKKTSNGLKYKIIKPGSSRRPKPTSNVTCHYRGWLDNGKEFDSSYKRGEPADFPLNGVIQGWTEGLQLIGEGGEIELEIPARLGYGERGSPGAIPPNARLHFIVELIKVH